MVLIYETRKVLAPKMQNVLTGIIKPVARVLILYPLGCSKSHKLESPRAGEAKAVNIWFAFSRVRCNGLSIWQPKAVLCIDCFRSHWS